MSAMGLQGALRTGLMAWMMCLATAGLAQAEKLVSVMTLLNESGDDAVALELTDAIRAEAQQLDGWRVNDTKLSLSQLSLVHDCEPSEAACLEIIAEGIDAGMLLVGTVEPGGGSLLTVKLQVYERGSGFQEASARADFPKEEPNYTSLATELLGQLGQRRTDAESAPIVAPVPEPETVQPAPDMAAIEMTTPETEHDSMAWLGYSLLGLSAASAGLMVFSWYQIQSAEEHETYRSYRESIGIMAPGVSDVCDAAEQGDDYGIGAANLAQVVEQCDQGQTHATLQYVFMGVAAAAGVAGGIVLWQDGQSDDSARLTLEPRAGLAGAGLVGRLQL